MLRFLFLNNKNEQNEWFTLIHSDSVRNWDWVPWTYPSLPMTSWMWIYHSNLPITSHLLEYPLWVPMWITKLEWNTHNIKVPQILIIQQLWFEWCCNLFIYQLFPNYTTEEWMLFDFMCPLKTQSILRLSCLILCCTLFFSRLLSISLASNENHSFISISLSNLSLIIYRLLSE